MPSITASASQGLSPRVGKPPPSYMSFVDEGALRITFIAGCSLLDPAGIHLRPNGDAATRRSVRLKTWAEFKRVAAETKPKSVVYVIAKSIPARDLTRLKLILPWKAGSTSSLTRRRTIGCGKPGSPSMLTSGATAFSTMRMSSSFSRRNCVERICKFSPIGRRSQLGSTTSGKLLL
jgi:hypothetical protein